MSDEKAAREFSERIVDFVYRRYSYDDTVEAQQAVVDDVKAELAAYAAEQNRTLTEQLALEVDKHRDVDARTYC